jgi:hypothetical protein
MGLSALTNFLSFPWSLEANNATAFSPIECFYFILPWLLFFRLKTFIIGMGYAAWDRYVLWQARNEPASRYLPCRRRNGTPNKVKTSLSTPWGTTLENRRPASRFMYRRRKEIRNEATMVTKRCRTSRRLIRRLQTISNNPKTSFGTPDAAPMADGVE